MPTANPVPPLHIAVDVDDVIVELLPAWLARYNSDYQQALAPADVDRWEIDQCVIPECGRDIFRYLEDRTLWDQAAMVPMADEGVTWLRERGHRVVFVTSANCRVAGRKYERLQELGFLPAEPVYSSDYVEMTDKVHYGADVIVDDRMDTCLAWAASGRYAVLFDHHPNATDRRADGNPLVLRADGWAGVLQRILEIEAKHAKMQDVVRQMLDEEIGPLPAATELATDATSKPSNPKDIVGSNKVPLHLCPSTLIAGVSLAMLEGAVKYGRSNFRAVGVRASIYFDAEQRHMKAWWEGEDVDPESGLDHLFKAAACLAVLIDAKYAGKMKDDRMVSGGYAALMRELTPHVARLKALHADKAPKHYTIADNAALDGDDNAGEAAD